MIDPVGPRPALLVANPSADIYGSDLQMLETVRAMTERDWTVVVMTAQDGPLVARLNDVGATVQTERFPVLRRAYASAGGMLRLAGSAAPAVWRLRRRIRELGPCVVYVNTVTLPWCLLAARLARVPVVCHVHEAEIADRRSVRVALTAPLVLADRVIANGEPARRAACEVVPRLAGVGRIRVIENGVAGPAQAVPPPPATGSSRLIVLGRLSPRKATHVALAALATLRADGRDVVLDVCGDAFPGYEWYTAELEARAAQPDLAGAVAFRGYVTDVWAALARCHVLVAPSLGESLGNAVIQAQLATRPVVASDVQGHTESVIDGVTGVLVPPEDPDSMAHAVARLLDDPTLALNLASAGRRSAKARFSVSRYDDEMAAELAAWCTRGHTRHGAN